MLVIVIVLQVVLVGYESLLPVGRGVGVPMLEQLMLACTSSVWVCEGECQEHHQREH